LQLALDRPFITDQDNFDTEIFGCHPRAFNDDFGRTISAHRVNGDFRHTGGLTLLFLYQDPATPIVAAVGAGAVRQGGFAAIGTGTPLRRGEGIVGAALVFNSFRGSSFGNRHQMVLSLAYK
jgi:hypothetical protein